MRGRDEEKSYSANFGIAPLPLALYVILIDVFAREIGHFATANEDEYLRQRRVAKLQRTDEEIAIRVMPTSQKEIQDSIRRNGGARTQLAAAFFALLFALVSLQSLGRKLRLQHFCVLKLPH